MINFNIFFLLISFFTNSSISEPCNDGFMIVRRYECHLSSSNSFLETEEIRDSLGRTITQKRFERNRKPEVYTYSYKDTLEYDSTFRKIFKTTYVYSESNNFIRKKVLWTDDKVFKIINKDKTVELFRRRYSIDSLLEEEVHLINNVKIDSFTFKYDDKKRLKTKNYSYYRCCTGQQPIIDRIEYEYDNQTGQLIQECKIIDKNDKRSYKKGALSTISTCNCIFIKHINNSIREEISFENDDTITPNFETGDKSDLYYRYTYNKIK